VNDKVNVINEETSMSLLDTTILFKDLLAYGAAQLYSESHLRKCFGARAQITVDEALRSKAGVSRVLFLVLRPEIVPHKAMHDLAVESCQKFLDRLEGDGVYLDFRLRGLLEAKTRWANEEISMGALAAAQHAAQRIQHDVASHPDERTRLATLAVNCALRDDAALAVKQVYYTAIKVYEDAPFSAAFQESVREHLSRVSRP